MSALFDSGVFSNNEGAWHGLGTVCEHKLTDWKEAYKLSKLDYEIISAPIKTTVTEVDEEGNKTDRDIEISDKQAILRNDTKSILGVTGSKYKILQNSYAFEFFEPFLHEGDCFITSAIGLDGGKRIAVVAQIENNVREIVPGDTVENYLTFTTSHDGNSSSVLFFTGVRTVCMNTLIAALANAGASRKVRHIGNQEQRLLQVRQTIDLYRRHMDDEANIYRELANKEMTMENFRNYLEVLFEPDINRAKEKEGVDTIALEKLRRPRRCLENFMFSEDLQMNGVRDTAWAGFNAVTEYVTHQRTKNYENNLSSVLFRNERVLLDKAKELALQA